MNVRKIDGAQEVLLHLRGDEINRIVYALGYIAPRMANSNPAGYLLNEAVYEKILLQTSEFIEQNGTDDDARDGDAGRAKA